MTFLIELNSGWKAWARCYKDYVDGKKIKGMTLWNLETYGRIVVRLKAIEYKEDFFYYLSSYSSDLSLQAICIQTFPSSTKTQFAQASNPRFVSTI